MVESMEAKEFYRKKLTKLQTAHSLVENALIELESAIQHEAHAAGAEEQVLQEISAELQSSLDALHGLCDAVEAMVHLGQEKEDA
jgi:prefoldin subunit 5